MSRCLVSPCVSRDREKAFLYLIALVSSSSCSCHLTIDNSKFEEFLHVSSKRNLISATQGRRLASAHRPEDIVVRTHARSLAHRIGKFIAIQPIPCYLALACDYLSSGFR
jgi:hypothetical protein